MSRRKMQKEPSDFFTCDLMWDHLDGCLEPLSEIKETDEEIILQVDMPCVRDKDDIEIRLTENSATIEAKIQKTVQYERWGTFQRSARFCRFSKVFELPAKVDPDKSKARFIKNILELRLPKKERVFKVKIE